MFSCNQFPGYYVPWSSHAVNEVQYGYNLSYYIEKQNFIFRVGCNFNKYKRQSTIDIEDTDFGIEGGGEFELLDRKRRWIINVGLLLYKGWSWSYQRYPARTDKYLINEWGMGPLVVFGYKIKNRWIVTTEYSVSVGAAFYELNDVRYDKKIPAFRNWKWFGIGFRYYLK